MAELHNNIRVVRTISPISLGATGSGGKAGAPVDVSSAETVEFVVGYGAITATGATVDLIIKEGDVTGTMTSVADADLIGTELSAALAVQASARTSGVGKNITKRIGYRGVKKYVSATLVPHVSGGIVAGAEVLLSGSRKRPTAA